MMIAVSSGDSSRQNPTPMTLAVYSIAPKIWRMSATVTASVTPTKKFTRKTMGIELTPMRTACRAVSRMRSLNPLKGAMRSQ